MTTKEQIHDALQTLVHVCDLRKLIIEYYEIGVFNLRSSEKVREHFRGSLKRLFVPLSGDVLYSCDFTNFYVESLDASCTDGFREYKRGNGDIRDVAMVQSKIYVLDRLHYSLWCYDSCNQIRTIVEWKQDNFACARVRITYKILFLLQSGKLHLKKGMTSSL